MINTPQPDSSSSREALVAIHHDVAAREAHVMQYGEHYTNEAVDLSKANKLASNLIDRFAAGHTKTEWIARCLAMQISNAEVTYKSDGHPNPNFPAVNSVATRYFGLSEFSRYR